MTTSCQCKSKMLISLLRRITYCRYSQLKQRLLAVRENTAGNFYPRKLSSLASERGVQSDETRRRRLVLGIETSCDDTGAAVVDDVGTIVGDALHSQTKTHVEFGGIIPPIARDLHQKHIESVVQLSLERAGVSLQELDAVAVTVKPGLAICLKVGLEHALSLVKSSGLPLIPIHHMEAHALTARMIEKIDFPFLVLLASGGHCLLAVARNVSDFLLLGTSADDSPGEAYDKTARHLKLKNLSACSGLSGGAAIELIARQGDPSAFKFPQVMTRLPDCNFSFSGIKTAAKKIIDTEEKRLNVPPSAVVPSAPDICASFQYAVFHHLARRLQRAFLFCELKGLLPQNKTLVVSGGVASNVYLREGLQKVCEQYSCRLVCPPPQLCTDNGIMIAWNGMEKLLADTGIARDFDVVDIQAKCPLGKDITQDVIDAAIKLPRLRL